MCVFIYINISNGNRCWFSFSLSHSITFCLWVYIIAAAAVAVIVVFVFLYSHIIQASTFTIELVFFISANCWCDAMLCAIILLYTVICVEQRHTNIHTQHRCIHHILNTYVKVNEKYTQKKQLNYCMKFIWLTFETRSTYVWLRVNWNIVRNDMHWICSGVITVASATVNAKYRRKQQQIS